MTHLHLDFETYSEADIKKTGAYYYATHPSTEALMLGWAIDDGEPQVWDIAAGDEMPHELREAIFIDVLRKGGEIYAFNATFERLILRHCLFIDIPIERFRCVQVRSYGLAFTGGLDMVAEQFNLGIQKDAKGKSLINRFSKPQPKNHNVRRWTAENDPEGWAEFKKYCKQDVVVERQLWKKCEPYHFPEQEWANYALSEKINDRGVPVDRKLIKAALAVNEAENIRLKEEMKARMPGVDNPNSRDQLLAWLKTQGVVMLDATKETVATTLEKVEDENVKEVLRLKQQLAKTSVTKFKAFDRVICPDGRVHGMFQFGGASRTMRWAGRIVQLQNLPRGGNTTKDPLTAAEMLIAGGQQAALSFYGQPKLLLSDLVRSTITAGEGEVLNVSDLHSIESVVLGWVSDCKAINDCFAAGRDTYRTFATTLFDVPYDEVTDKQRKLCKPPVLGGGYKLGGKGLVGYSDSMGIEMDLPFAEAAIKALRADWPEVVDFWEWCKAAVFHTTLTGQEYPGPHGLKTFAHGEFLCLRLPSGRNLYYYRPKIMALPAPWDRNQKIDQFTYYGTNRHANGKWMRIKAHEGGITENIVQAIARDVLVEWAHRADKAGFNLFLHVHDELGAEEKSDRLAELNALLDEPISWAPGLKVGAAGYVAKRYKKD